jgi:hypothetical protein
MNRVPNDAEPGTGTQIHSFATPPDRDDDKPNSRTLDGQKWKVGHDYLDTEIGDVCQLVAIVGRSSWCDTRDPEDCPPELVFEYERYEHGSIRVDPATPDFDPDRFVERYTRSINDPGAPNPPW